MSMDARQDAPLPDDLEEKHAKMRARDRERIESGEATPQQIQDENSMFKFTSFEILNFTA